jgi:hypothetical protein
MAASSQTLTIEYLVPGKLDGTSPSPAFSVDQGSDDAKQPDSDGVYRFSADELSENGGNLGLIDVTSDFGNRNLFANRLVTWFYLDAPGAPGAGGAAIDSVNLRDGVAQRQILHAGLAGRERFFGSGFFVPQGSRLRVDGFEAGIEPILLRLNVHCFSSVEELLLALESARSQAGAQFSGYLTSATPIPGAALTPMPIDALDFSFDENVYEHVLGSSDVKVKVDGRYQIVPQASIDSTAGSSRSDSRTELYRDTGAGFLLIPGSSSYAYHRSTTSGEGTAPVNKIVTLNAGDVIRSASVRIAGAAPLAYIGGGCRMSLIKLPEV